MTTLAFIADENVDAAIVARLRADGLDVAAVSEMDPGIDDDRVLAIANEQTRILITSDRDFGELVFRLGQATAGILLLRLAGLSAGQRTDLISSAIAEHGAELAGAFSVIAPGVMRIRRP